MENLTRKADLVRLADDLGSDPRRHQVVYRKVGQRKKYLVSLPPGTFFRPTLFQRIHNHVVYEVSSESELVHEFSQQFHTHDEKHDFILTFVLIYQVSDPEKLIESVGQDPLRQLEASILREIGGQVSRLPWAVIWKGGHELDRELESLRERGSTVVHNPVQWLSTRSSSWGLTVHRLTVDRALPPDATSPVEDSSIEGERKRRREVAGLGDQAFVEIKKVGIEFEQKACQMQADEDLQERIRAQELRAVDHKGQLLARSTVERLVANLHGILDRTASRVDNIPQLRRTVADLQGLRSELLSLAAPFIEEPPSPALAAGAAPALLTSRTFDNSTGLGKVFDELHLFLPTFPSTLHKPLVAPLLRLLSELFLGEEAAAEDLAAWRQALAEGLEEHCNELDCEQADFVQRMADVENLRHRLGFEKTEETP